MGTDAYAAFARVYDAWQRGYSKPFSQAILPFYEREVMRRRIPDRSLADLACGTGTFLLQWDQRNEGWTLIGTDRSAAMLREARRKLLRNRPDARLLHQTLEATRLPRPVGVAVCVFDSINHLTSLRTLRSALRGAVRAIMPSGLFLFDLHAERAFPRLFSGTWSVEFKDLRVSVSARCSMDATYGVARFTASFGPPSRRKRLEFTIRERNWRTSEVRAALEEAGFKPVRILRIRPYPSDEVDAPRALWVCQR